MDMHAVYTCNDMALLPVIPYIVANHPGIPQSLQVSNFFSHIKLSNFAYFWRFSHINVNVTSDSDSIKVAKTHCHCF